MRAIRRQDGFTLIELIMIIVIIGILAGVATMKMMTSVETSRYEATRAELEELARAIAGNAAVKAAGAQCDFGYIGDIGALPPDLDALAINPGYGTWSGPYIGGNFGNDDFKKDAWDAEYIYSDTLLRSVGSGSNIDRVLASSSDDLLNNSISGYLLDADLNMPGNAFRDSLIIDLIYPDGAGNMTTASINPDGNGSFVFTGIPVGNHALRVIYLPDGDTVEYQISVNPGSGTCLDIIFPADLW